MVLHNDFTGKRTAKLVSCKQIKWHASARGLNKFTSAAALSSEGMIVGNKLCILLACYNCEGKQIKSNL
ncbi:hypothetical protein ACTXT7_014572 [Hymenolepis weldensis]